MDEGTLAGSAIAHTFASLEQQTESDQKHQQRKSLAALFRELSAIGDKNQEPLIKQYLNDPDSTVQDEAKTALQKIEVGDRSIFPKAVDF